jgi:hypothetical protein
MTRVLIIGLALLATGCSGTPTPATSPSPQSPVPGAPAPPQGTTISGVVYESTPEGLRPLPGVGLDISVEYQSWPPMVTTDNEGRYQLALLSSQNFKVRAEKPGYSQPCAATFMPTANTVLDIYMVPDAILSTAGVPSSMPTRQPVVMGNVSEKMANGDTRRLSGAMVIADFSGGMGWSPSATTMSDAAGRYFLCGVTSTLGIELYVTKSGYQSATVSAGLGGGRFDVELTRQ